MATKWPYNTAEAVRVLHDLFEKHHGAAEFDRIGRAFVDRYPDMPIEQFVHVIKVSQAEDEAALEEYQQQYKRHRRRTEDVLRITERCAGHHVVLRSWEIKAAQCDPICGVGASIFNSCATSPRGNTRRSRDGRRTRISSATRTILASGTTSASAKCRVRRASIPGHSRSVQVTGADRIPFSLISSPSAASSSGGNTTGAPCDGSRGR